MQISYPEIIEALSAALAARGLGHAAPQLMVVEPPRAWGVTTNVCFALGKHAAAAEIERVSAELDKKAAKQVAGQLAKEASERLARELAAELSQLALPFVTQVEAEGAYINFYYDVPRLVAHVVETVDAGGRPPTAAVSGRGEAMLRPDSTPEPDRAKHGFAPTVDLTDPAIFGHGAPTGKRIMVEYAQPNTHKDFHVGHLRNASIGQAIANLQEFEGSEVYKATYIGDVGAHVAKAMVIFELIHSNKIESLQLAVQQLFEPKDSSLVNPSTLHLLQSMVDQMPLKIDEMKIDDWNTCYVNFGKLKTALTDLLNTEIDKQQDSWRRTISHYSVMDSQQKVWLAGWEYGLDAIRNIWRISTENCLKSFKTYFSELQITFSDEPYCWFFESTVDDTKLGQKTAAELNALGIAEIDESEEYKGALYVDFAKHADALKPDGTPVFRDDEKKRIRQLGKMTILRSDGTSLYQTKELGLAKHKFDLIREQTGHELDQSLYVVGAEQKLYFEQVFAILRLWGFPNAENCQHISYELVVLPEGKMSSREGNIVSYRELRDEAVKRAEEITREKGIGAADAGGAVDEAKVKDIAHKIAIAAIKFTMLQVTGAQQIVFDFEQALSFSGRAAPYLQYAYARAGKLVAGLEDAGRGEAMLRPNAPDDERAKQGFAPTETDSTRAKHGFAPTEVGFELHQSEVELARQLSLFPGVCRSAAADCEPATLCTYLYGLATAFSDFYRDCRVLDAPEPERGFRRRLTSAFRQVLRTGFAILALPLPEEM